MDAVERLAALNRAWEALRQIQDIEGRFDRARSRSEFMELVSQIAEARSAIDVIKEAVDRKAAEAPNKDRDAPPTAPTFPEG